MANFQEKSGCLQNVLEGKTVIGCNRHQLSAILAFVAAEEGLLTRIFQANHKMDIN